MESRPAHTCPVAIHVRWPRRLLWRALLVILTVYAGSIMELSQNLGLFASGSTTHPVITDFALMQLRGGRGSRLERESKGSESKSKRRKGSSVERSAYSRVMGNLEGLEKSMGNGEERLHNGRESRRHKRHGSDRHRQRKKNRDKDRKHRRHRRRHHRTSRRRRSSSETYSSTYSDDASGGPASGSKHQIKSIPTAAPTRFPTRAPTVEKITEADLVTKMSEFSRWLKESKKSLQDLTSYETRTHFERFVKMWNEGALSREVYGVPEEMNPNKVYNDEMEKLQLKAKEWAKRRQQYELRSNAGVNQPGGTTGPGLDPALAKLSRKERVKVMSMMAVDEISDVLVAMGPEEAASTAYLLEESQAIESVILMAENNPQAAGTLLPALEENLAEKILLKMDRALQNKVLAAKRGTYENLLLAKDSDFEEEYPELKHLSTEQIKAQLRDATKGYNPKDLPLTDAQREMAAEEKREIQRRKQIEAQRAAATNNTHPTPPSLPPLLPHWELDPIVRSVFAANSDDDVSIFAEKGSLWRNRPRQDLHDHSTHIPNHGPLSSRKIQARYHHAISLKDAVELEEERAKDFDAREVVTRAKPGEIRMKMGAKRGLLVPEGDDGEGAKGGWREVKWWEMNGRIGREVRVARRMCPRGEGKIREKVVRKLRSYNAMDIQRSKEAFSKIYSNSLEVSLARALPPVFAGKTFAKTDVEVWPPEGSNPSECGTSGQPLYNFRLNLRRIPANISESIPKSLEGLPPPGTREARLREKRRISRIHAAARREREDVIPESGGANIEDIEGGGDEDLLAELKMKQSRKANTPTSTRHESALQNAPPSAAANRLKQEREREARQDAYHEFQKREGEEKEKKIARMRERFSRDPLKAHAGEDEDGRERRLRMRKFFEDAQKKRDEEVSGKHMDDGNWREMIFNKDDHSDSIVPEYTDAVKRWEKRKLMDYSDLDEDMMQNTDILFNHPGQSDVELPDAEVHDSETEASGRAPPPDPDEYNHEIYQENELELQANFKGISKGFMEKPGAGFEPRNDDIQDEDNL